MKKNLEEFLWDNRPLPPEAPLNEKAEILRQIALMPAFKNKTEKKQVPFLWPWKVLGSGFAMAAVFALFMVVQPLKNSTDSFAQEKEEIGEFLLSTLENYSGSLNNDEAENYF